MATQYRPKNILITGAAGFIASHVCNRLIRNYPDYKIVVLDKLDYCSNLKNLLPSQTSPNFKFIKGDIASADLVNFILLTESIDTIMHFAAQTHVDNSFGNSFEFTKNNIYGTHVLLEACKVTGQIKRFIHVSTDEVYGETEEDAVVGNHEASQLLPTNPYSATKAGAEMLVMAYGRSYGLPVITTRGNNVYGPNQFPEKLIPKFILLAMKGSPLPIHGDGSNVRSYLYCEDVAEAFEVVLHKGEIGHVYNIGTKKERRVIDVAREICKLFSLNPDTQIKFVDNRPFNDQRYYLDDQKLKSLGWSERTTWEEGLKKTMDWYVRNPDWWGDVSGALLPHPRMLMVPGVERNAANDSASAPVTNNQTQRSAMVVPVSKNNPAATEQKSLKFLIYGRTGWIGGLLGKLCEKQGIAYEYGKGRLENRSALLEDIRAVKPTHVFNAAGVTGRPNVDWCETHRTQTIRTNVAGTLTLADVCREYNILVVNYATGCIFEYDDAHPLGSGIGFKEEDRANFTGSFYSKTKAMLLREYDNVCTLRVRMPISSDLGNPRNFITKITRYNRVVDIPNSMTILDELLPISIEMAKRNLRGIWNFTNPGVVSHNEILAMYKKYVDPSFKWANFTLEEQARVIVAPRSNNELDASKLKEEFPGMLSIKDSLIKYVFEPNKKGAELINNEVRYLHRGDQEETTTTTALRRRQGIRRPLGAGTTTVPHPDGAPPRDPFPLLLPHGCVPDCGEWRLFRGCNSSLKLREELTRALDLVEGDEGGMNDGDGTKEGSIESFNELVKELTSKQQDIKTFAFSTKAMLLRMEHQVESARHRESLFWHLASHGIPEGLHCLCLKLAEEYAVNALARSCLPKPEYVSRLGHPSFHHVVLLTDNVLAASVVIASAVEHSAYPEKLVFHIVTDKKTYAPMHAWFAINPIISAVVEVKGLHQYEWSEEVNVGVKKMLEIHRLIWNHHRNSLKEDIDVRKQEGEQKEWSRALSPHFLSQNLVDS
ncbi:Rhm1p, partial [Turnera subulata]